MNPHFRGSINQIVAVFSVFGIRDNHVRKVIAAA
jgi:hypothetical protein